MYWIGLFEPATSCVRDQEPQQQGYRFTKLRMIDILDFNVQGQWSINDKRIFLLSR